MYVRFSEYDKNINLSFNKGSDSSGVSFSENDRTLSTDFKENEIFSEETFEVYKSISC